MKTPLKLAENLSFPLEFVTQTSAIVAKRRSGKSYLARRIVEQLHKAGQQVVVVDPKGDWWGLLSSSDGKSPGLPFVIIGGERGHVPLEATGGEVVAKLVVEERVSALLDLSLLRKHEVATFMAMFLETLYRLKAVERFRTPMMLAIDEADAIAPQKPQPNEMRMLGAANDIVRRGGQRGIGCMMITQRTAVLAKDVLTQVQILIALRTISPQDLAAMNAWVDVHGTQAERKTLMDSLPSLPVGDSWVWSPGWPTDDGIFRRIHTLPIETFDSGATPKPGEKRIEPKKVADVDLDAVRAQMAATIERAKQDDPKELRKRVAELEKELAVSKAASQERVKRVEVPVLTASNEKSVLTLVEKLETVASQLRGNLKQLAQPVYLPVKIQPTVRKLVSVAPDTVSRRPIETRRVYEPGSIGNSGLQRMLVALAQRPTGLSSRQLGVRSSMSSKSGTFSTYLSKARTAGWISGSSDRMQITESGLEVLGSYEPLPTKQALLDHWLADLGQSGASRILAALADAYPKALTSAEVAEAAGMQVSGTFSTYVSKLRSLELVEGRGELRASKEFFE